MNNNFYYHIKNKTDLYKQILLCGCNYINVNDTTNNNTKNTNDTNNNINTILDSPTYSNFKEDYIFKIENLNCLIMNQILDNIDKNIMVKNSYNHFVSSNSLLDEYKNEYYNKFNEVYPDKMTPCERSVFLKNYKLRNKMQ